MNKVKNMRKFEAYGFEFLTWSSACRYKALVRILDTAKVDEKARMRMIDRFMEIHGGVPVAKAA